MLMKDNFNSSSSKENVKYLDSPKTLSKLFEELASELDTIQNDKLISPNDQNQKINTNY